MTVRKYKETVREVKQMIDFKGKIWYNFLSGSPRIADVATVLVTHRQVLNHTLKGSE